MSDYSISPKERLILELFRIKTIEFGNFKLKSGIVSPYYIDLRLLVSYPYLFGVVADVFWEELRLMAFDLIVGVPYAAVPKSMPATKNHPSRKAGCVKTSFDKHYFL